MSLQLRMLQRQEPSYLQMGPFPLTGSSAISKLDYLIASITSYISKINIVVTDMFL